ncbi:hypothetical protein AHF37_10662 [Paragonimus kellicotti]|nr:hypothetical protein AHF37_10662 [Paragonimus kellicotti]
MGIPYKSPRLVTLSTTASLPSAEMLSRTTSSACSVLPSSVTRHGTPSQPTAETETHGVCDSHACVGLALSVSDVAMDFQVHADLSRCVEQMCDSKTQAVRNKNWFSDIKLWSNWLPVINM